MELDVGSDVSEELTSGKMRQWIGRPGVERRSPERIEGGGRAAGAGS